MVRFSVGGVETRGAVADPGRGDTVSCLYRIIVSVMVWIPIRE